MYCHFPKVVSKARFGLMKIEWLLESLFFIYPVGMAPGLSTEIVDRGLSVPPPSM